ncbi:MAG: ABC transporter permease [Dehalococcoidia bacterium]
MAERPPLAAPPLAPAQRGWAGDAARRLVRNRAALLGLVIVGAFGLLALFAPLVDHHTPTDQHLDSTLAGPSTTFWLGTDQLGRDQYSRLVHGARVSLAVGVLTQVVALGLGLAVGLMAGLGGRRADSLLMRMTDVTYAFPDLLMVILLVSIFGASAPMIILAIGLVSWTTIARLVRGQILSLRERDFVLSARALGASDWRIAWHHLLPNVLGPVIVTATFGIPAAIFAEAALAFIGLGLPPPTPTWGRLVADSFNTMFAAPYLAVTSCLAIAITMMAFTFIGDGLRDALDPRSPSRHPLPEVEPSSAAAFDVAERRAA